MGMLLEALMESSVGTLMGKLAKMWSKLLVVYLLFFFFFPLLNVV